MGLAAVIPWIRPLDTTDRRALVLLAAAVTVELGAIVVQRLYLARVAARRSVELSGLARAALASGCTALLIGDLAGVSIAAARVIAGAAVSFVLLALCRGIYASWLSTQRALGYHSRDLVLVGTNDEGLSLQSLLATHPELGYRVCGVTGDSQHYVERAWTVPYLGSADETLEALVGRRADGVLVAAGAMHPTLLNDFTREMLHHDIHVHLSSGLQGIDHRRLRALPLAHEPLFYLEPSTASRASCGSSGSSTWSAPCSCCWSHRPSSRPPPLQSG